MRILLSHTFSTNAHFVLGIVLEETLDTTAGKLWKHALVTTFLIKA